VPIIYLVKILEKVCHEFTFGSQAQNGLQEKSIQKGDQ
jgi:hypothetical protein